MEPTETPVTIPDNSSIEATPGIDELQTPPETVDEKVVFPV